MPDPSVDAVNKLLAELEPNDFAHWTSTYSFEEIPFNGDPLDSIERHLRKFDWTIVEIDVLPSWRDEIAAAQIPPTEDPAFGRRAKDVVGALERVLGDEPEVWLLEIEPRVAAEPDVRLYEAVLKKDFALMERLVDESDEFQRQHPRRPDSAWDAAFLSRRRLFLLELAFDA